MTHSATLYCGASFSLRGASAPPCHRSLITLLFVATTTLAHDLAITGATLIDGNGGPPKTDATIVIHAGRIAAVGPTATIPSGAKTIDAKGRFIIPGLIDTNVHLSLYGGARDRYETLAKYNGRQDEIVLEAAQLALRYGVTTVRDSYGMLMPLTRVRDRIARGELLGARVLAAGNIVGWGGPYSISFSLTPQGNLTRFQEEMNDAIAQGAGENLADLTPIELRTAISKYLDKGPDFLKFGGTSHFSQPTYIGFSLESQKAMVEEAHKRGRVAETHSTTIEGLRLSIEAGVDLIQHPEVLSPREMPADLIQVMHERKVICSMLANTITGEPWTKHLKDQTEIEKKYASPAPPLTGAGERRKAAELGLDLETRRRNAQQLIAGGCITTVGTDNYWAAAPEFAIDPKPDTQSHGIGTILAIEGLVQLGMTPAQAITAGTRNGALACRRLADFGTVESGKIADLVILDADPLADIHNIRKVRSVIAGGHVVDPAKLPENRVLSLPPRAPDLFRARIETSRGPIVFEVHREWSPIGVDQFYSLATAGYFDGSRFFRVVKDRWVQFGINGDPPIAKKWRERAIPDEPRRVSNTRGTVAFAFAVPNGRTTQIFINLVDNSANHDKEPFVPFARIVEGMEVADQLYSGYGETSGGGIRAGRQAPLFEGGNAYLDRNFPKLDRIERVVILGP